MNKKMLAIVICVACVAACFTGCKNSRAEKQQSYKEAGLTSMTNGEYKKAVKSFDKALSYSNHKVTTEEIDICYYKAAAQYQAGDPKGAIETYTALIKYDEKDPNPIFLRGSIYLNEKDLNQALKDYKSAVKCDENNYELYIQIFQNLNAQDDRDEGLEFLNMALEIEGNKANNYMQRGRIYLILEQYDAAKKALNKAIDKNLDEAKVYLAQVYLAEKDDDKAEEILNDFIKNDKPTSEALNMVGCMKMNQGDYETALKYFQKGLALDTITNKKDLMKNEIAALEKTGDFEAAKEKLKSFLAEYPTDEEGLREQKFLSTR